MTSRMVSHRTLGPGSTQGIPLVHASRTWEIASSGEAGCLIATDGTHPMRVMLRVSINTASAVWTNDTSIATLPDRVYIDQMYFYALSWDKARSEDLQVSAHCEMCSPETFVPTMKEDETERVLLSTPFESKWEHDARGQVKYQLRSVSQSRWTPVTSTRFEHRRDHYMKQFIGHDSGPSILLAMYRYKGVMTSVSLLYRHVLQAKYLENESNAKANMLYHGFHIWYPTRT